MQLPRSWETVPTTDIKPEPEILSGKILIAEDDELVREVLEATLSETHTLVFAVDGQEALQAALVEDFDVALIDLSMPKVPGDLVAREIQETKPTVVTVLMTGWDLGEDDPRRTPFDDHLPKPLPSREEVRDLVARCLQVHESRKLRA